MLYLQTLIPTILVVLLMTVYVFQDLVATRVIWRLALMNTKRFCRRHEIPDDHGWRHFEIVYGHMFGALAEYTDLGPWERLVHLLSALLHDVDDHKLFKTVGYSNARALMRQSYVPAKIIELVIENIDLVSASKNGNSLPAEKLKILARECDRIEAIGEIGIVRAYIYTIDKKRAIFTADTPIVCNDHELEALNIKARYDEYLRTNGAGSVTMIDHFYDKMLHIGEIQTKNRWLTEVAKRRDRQMRDWLYRMNIIRRDHGDEACLREINRWALQVVPLHYNPKDDSPVARALLAAKISLL
jgi:uncharacterized protein